MEKDEIKINFIRTTILLPKKLHDSLKMMCILTDSTMSNFVKIAVQDKIKELKNKQKSRESYND